MEEGNIGTLVINYEKLMDLESKGKKVISYKEDYAYDLQNNVINALSNISSDDSAYISDAEIYIRKKISELTEDTEVLKDFINQVNELIELATSMDQEVASLYSYNYVTIPAKSTKVDVSIIDSIFDFILNFSWDGDSRYDFLFNPFGLKESFQDLRTEIRFWYECKGGKELFNIGKQVLYLGVGILGVIGALTWGAPFLIICGTIAAIIGVANSLVAIYNSSRAFLYAIDENPAMARRVGERLTLSNELRAYNFKDKKTNENSEKWAKRLDVTEIVLSVACLAYIVIPKIGPTVSTISNFAKSLTWEKVANGIKNIPRNVSNYFTNLDNSMKATLQESLREEFREGAKITSILGQATKSSVSSVRNVLDNSKMYNGLLDDFLKTPSKQIPTTLHNKILSALNIKPLKVVQGLFYTSKSTSVVNYADDVIDASKTTGILDDIAKIDVPSVSGDKVIKGGSNADLGNKADYLFGKATGNKHNIERSKAMQAELKKIGVYDNKSGREYISKHLNDVLKDSTNISNVDTRTYIAKELLGQPVVKYTATTRESLLMGPGGAVKVESVWDGNRLITVVIKGGN